MADNVIARKQPGAPEGVEFPVWLYRADGRSAQADGPKEFGDLMRAGYTSMEEKKPEKPAAKPKGKKAK